mmetsp:Transcript_37505/g.67863  ORF Transcript_37505/g.67863 Transcript_37505/m.67863 type:complete len:262 (-) Transcript_37505:896-1681(-)
MPCNTRIMQRLPAKSAPNTRRSSRLQHHVHDLVLASCSSQVQSGPAPLVLCCVNARASHASCQEDLRNLILLSCTGYQQGLCSVTACCKILRAYPPDVAFGRRSQGSRGPWPRRRAQDWRWQLRRCSQHRLGQGSVVRQEKCCEVNPALLCGDHKRGCLVITLDGTCHRLHKFHAGHGENLRQRLLKKAMQAKVIHQGLTTHGSRLAGLYLPHCVGPLFVRPYTAAIPEILQTGISGHGVGSLVKKRCATPCSTTASSTQR